MDRSTDGANRSKDGATPSKDGATRSKDGATHAAPRRLRLVVPVVLTVAVIAGAMAAVTTSIGCGDDSPSPDASVDAAPDTPIV